MVENNKNSELSYTAQPVKSKIDLVSDENQMPIDMMGPTNDDTQYAEFERRLFGVLAYNTN